MSKEKNVIACSLESYNKKYRNRKHRLLKYTKKEVEQFDKANKTKDYLLRGHKWALIKDTYYEIPKAPRLTWFRNLNAAAQAGICVLGAGVVATAITVPLVVLNNGGSNIIIDPEFKDDVNIDYVGKYDDGGDIYKVSPKTTSTKELVGIKEVYIGNDLLINQTEYFTKESQSNSKTIHVIIRKVALDNHKGKIRIVPTLESKEEGISEQDWKNAFDALTGEDRNYKNNWTLEESGVTYTHTNNQIDGVREVDTVKTGELPGALTNYYFRRNEVRMERRAEDPGNGVAKWQQLQFGETKPFEKFSRNYDTYRDLFNSFTKMEENTFRGEEIEVVPYGGHVATANVDVVFNDDKQIIKIEETVRYDDENNSYVEEKYENNFSDYGFGRISDFPDLREGEVIEVEWSNAIDLILKDSENRNYKCTRVQKQSGHGQTTTITSNLEVNSDDVKLVREDEEGNSTCYEKMENSSYAKIEIPDSGNSDFLITDIYEKAAFNRVVKNELSNDFMNYFSNMNNFGYDENEKEYTTSQNDVSYTVKFNEKAQIISAKLLDTNIEGGVALNLTFSDYGNVGEIAIPSHSNVAIFDETPVSVESNKAILTEEKTYINNSTMFCSFDLSQLDIDLTKSIKICFVSGEAPGTKSTYMTNPSVCYNWELQTITLGEEGEFEVTLSQDEVVNKNIDIFVQYLNPGEDSSNLKIRLEYTPTSSSN